MPRIRSLPGRGISMDFGTAMPRTITAINAHGDMLLTKETSARRIAIPASAKWGAGIYFIKILSPDGNAVRRIVLR